MRPVLREQVEKSTVNRFLLIAADPDVAALRTTRPRELSLARDACEVVRASADAFAQAWRAGEGAETAALAGERTARRLAAQDVRTLVSFDRGRSLAPFRGTFKPRTPEASLLGYIAVKHRGYWAEAFLSAAEGPSEVH